MPAVVPSRAEVRPNPVSRPDLRRLYQKTIAERIRDVAVDVAIPGEDRSRNRASSGLLWTPAASRLPLERRRGAVGRYEADSTKAKDDRPAAKGRSKGRYFPLRGDTRRRGGGVVPKSWTQGSTGPYSRVLPPRFGKCTRTTGISRNFFRRSVPPATALFARPGRGRRRRGAASRRKLMSGKGLKSLRFVARGFHGRIQGRELRFVPPGRTGIAGRRGAVADGRTKSVVRPLPDAVGAMQQAVRAMLRDASRTQRPPHCRRNEKRSAPHRRRADGRLRLESDW